MRALAGVTLVVVAVVLVVGVTVVDVVDVVAVDNCQVPAARAVGVAVGLGGTVRGGAHVLAPLVSCALRGQ